MADEPAGPGGAQAPPYLGDFVVLTRTTLPTEAQILQGCLEAAGIPAMVADANLVQAHSFLTTAVGGVRVLVPAHCLPQAQEVLANLEQGAYRLDDAAEPAAPALRPVPGGALWNPDAAALWSLLFTPLFGSVLIWLNARRLADANLLWMARWWLLASALLTGSLLTVPPLADDPQAAQGHLRLLLAGYVPLWYFLGVRPQSQQVIARHGRGHARRDMVWPVLLGLAITTAVLIVRRP